MDIVNTYLNQGKTEEKAAEVNCEPVNEASAVSNPVKIKIKRS